MGGLQTLTFNKILIANRGEIACRIARTCRKLDIPCAGVYSDFDRESIHVRAVDEAVHIGATYLDIDKIIDAAKRVAADAIHPGYGFLAENADFAEACAVAGITFIGPRPETIRQLGSKASGRAIAESCGVPIVPGYQGGDLVAGAEALGYPLMIKAAAGGGGRGMRLVKDAEHFDAAVESAAREAKSAFGDGTLILERAIENAHHVEVQIFGDTQGRMVHLFERNCSMQRRHQKFIEEAPSPAINDVTRTKLFDAALAIGRAVNYVNAGTVEFLVESTGEFYFIEVNTRIQVEHPVTEMITGLDLIEMQIRIAEGRPLDDFAIVNEPQGHSIEVRICAEDPFQNFAPSVGRIHHRYFRGGRVEIGVESGGVVTPHYDSLLAKVIAHGPTREAAITSLLKGLRGSAVLGVATNLDYLRQVLETERFRQGRATTDFLPLPIVPDSITLESPARALALWVHHREISQRRILPGVGAFRNNLWRDASIKLKAHGHIYEAPVSGRIVHSHDWVPEFSAEIDGVTRSYKMYQQGVQYLINGHNFERLPRHPRPKSVGTNAVASSPMPGQVLRILVEPGATVKIGTPLVILEAMKMEQTVLSQMDGVVSAILVKTGDFVSPGQTLVQIGGS